MSFGYLAMGIVALHVYAAIAGLALRFSVWLSGTNLLVSEMAVDEDSNLKWLWAALFPLILTVVIFGIIIEGAILAIYYGGYPVWRVGKFFYSFSFPERAKKTNLPRAKAVK